MQTWRRSCQAAVCGLAALVAGAGASQAAEIGSAIDVDARLSQRVLKSGASQRVYLRIGIKGRTAGAARETRSPVNVALVVDRSGSMRGDKMVKAREAAMMAVDRLSANDVGSVIVALGATTAVG
mgnify:CR=1 FL=1